MTQPLLTKCKPYFVGVPDHVLQTLMLVCSAIVLARSLLRLTGYAGVLKHASSNSRAKASTTRAAPIEDLNLKDNGKIMLFVAIVVMAYVLSLQTVFEVFMEHLELITRSTTGQIGSMSSNLEHFVRMLATPYFRYYQARQVISLALTGLVSVTLQ